MKPDIILASQSPRRKQLLEMADISFRVKVSNTDESFPKELPLEKVPEYIAEQKAIAVQVTDPAQVIIAADTVVLLNNEILGKPTNPQEASLMLGKLSGNIHTVITGCCILFHGKKWNFSEKTEVEFHPLTSDQICHYVHHYKPFDKAGAYAIQEWIGVTGIKGIRGDFYNVMGLPVSRVLQILRKENLL